jgi:hypothetical protein
MSDVTRILDAIGRGDSHAAAKLVTLWHFFGLFRRGR